MENIAISNDGNDEINRKDKTKFLLVSPPSSIDFFLEQFLYIFKEIENINANNNIKFNINKISTFI